MINLLIVFILCLTLILFFYFKYVYHTHKYVEYTTISVMSNNNDKLPMYRKYIQRCTICGKLKKYDL